MMEYDDIRHVLPFCVFNVTRLGLFQWNASRLWITNYAAVCRLMSHDFPEKRGKSCPDNFGVALVILCGLSV